MPRVGIHTTIYNLHIINIPGSVPADWVRLSEFLDPAFNSLSLASSLDAEGAFASIKYSFPNILSRSRLGNDRTLRFKCEGRMSVPKVCRSLFRVFLGEWCDTVSNFPFFLFVIVVSDEVRTRRELPSALISSDVVDDEIDVTVQKIDVTESLSTCLKDKIIYRRYDLI